VRSSIGVIILSLEYINMKLYAIKNLRVNEITPSLPPSPPAAAAAAAIVFLLLPDLHSSPNFSSSPPPLLPPFAEFPAARLILRDIVFTSSVRKRDPLIRTGFPPNYNCFALLVAVTSSLPVSERERFARRSACFAFFGNRETTARNLSN
jgi:hypothetical protein